MGISVIIPTLGGENLDKTISYLNNSIIIPDEIIICIPEKFYEKPVINRTKENIKNKRYVSSCSESRGI